MTRKQLELLVQYIAKAIDKHCEDKLHHESNWSGWTIREEMDGLIAQLEETVEEEEEYE